MMLYKTIMIDPPWHEKGASRTKRGADKHYPLLKTEDIIRTIKESGVFTPNQKCHLYLWVTNNFLPDGLRVISELGFRYITNIVWVKDKFGLGYYFRGQHELCLFAVKGHLPPQHKIFNNNYWTMRRRKKSEDGGRTQWSGATQKACVKTPITVIHEKRRKHSQKPLKMYRLIETVSPPPRLEMFARERRQGWDVWGSEVPSLEQTLLETTV